MAQGTPHVRSRGDSVGADLARLAQHVFCEPSRARSTVSRYDMTPHATYDISISIN